MTKPIFTEEHLPPTTSYKANSGSFSKPLTGNGYNAAMSDLTREEITTLLRGIESRMDQRLERMERDADRRSQDYRHELALRDEAFRRELDAREKVVDERFSNFLAVQTERDKRLDESVATIRGEIGRLGSVKLNIWGAMATAVTIGIAIAALAIGIYQTGKSDSQPPTAMPSAQIQQAASAPAEQPKSTK